MPDETQTLKPRPGPSQRRVIRAMREYPDMDIQELASEIGRSVPVTRNLLRRLHERHGITYRIPGGPVF